VDVDFDGSQLLVGEEDAVRLLSLEGGESRALGTSLDEVWTTSLSPDGRYAAVESIM
jgi:hypothetical protein